MHLYTYTDTIRILDLAQIAHAEEPSAHTPYPTLIISLPYYGEVILTPSHDGFYPHHYPPHIYPAGTILGPVRRPPLPTPAPYAS